MNLTFNEIERHVKDFLFRINASGGFFFFLVLIISRHINKKYVSLFGRFSNDKEFLFKTFDLFLWAYLTDLTLDAFSSGEFNPWEIPKATFGAMILFNNYVEWMKSNYEERFVLIFFHLYNQQMKYQILEKQWEMPSEYCSFYINPEEYYKKQIVLLFPIIIIDLPKKVKNFSIKFLKDYYSYLLISDDLNDLAWDIQSKTLSYVIANFYERKKKLPSLNSDFHILFNHILHVLSILQSKLEKASKLLNIDNWICEEVFFSISYEEWTNKINQDRKPL